MAIPTVEELRAKFPGYYPYALVTMDGEVVGESFVVVSLDAFERLAKAAVRAATIRGADDIVISKANF